MKTRTGGARIRLAAVAAGLWVVVSPIATAETPPPVDLEALLAEAEANHPELLALSARRDAADRVPSRSETLPDPMVSVSYTNEGFDSFTLGSTPDSDLTFSWTQELPYPGKRVLEGDVARGDATTAARRIEAGRARIRGEVKRLYFELHRTDRTLELLSATRGTLVSLVASARARYESGAGALEEVLKAQTEVAAIEVGLAMNREDRHHAEAALAAAVGRRDGTPFGPARTLPPIVVPDREALEASVIAASPELRLREAMVDTESRRLELAERSQKPDLMVGASYANRGGLDPMITGMFGMRLPVYRARKQAQAVAEAEHGLEAARHEVELETNLTLARARNLLGRLDRATALVPLYAEGLIPQARSTLDAATGSYAAGTTDFLGLLDDVLKLLRYETEYEAQRVDALQVLATLEELSGMDLIPHSTGGFDE